MANDDDSDGRTTGDWDGRARHARTERSTQPEPEASSDGDRSWAEHPITADPHEDRSVEAVIDRSSPQR